MAGQFRVLFVCTANICRSPMAEAMTRHALRRHPRIIAESAGIYGHEGSPIAPGSAAALATLGIAHNGHRGRVLTPEMVEQADLVLTMEAVHRDTITASTPAARTKTFTLREFTRAVAGVHPDAADIIDRTRLLVASAAQRRDHRSGDDDVPDPYGGPPTAYQSCARLLQAELAPLHTRRS